MLGTSELIAFIPTTKPVEARKFYEATLELRLVEDNDFALLFDANGVMLRVTKVEQFAPAQHTVLGWKVEDIAGTVRELRARGVEMQRYDGLKQDDSGVWTSPSGARVAWFRDPDGNILSVTQF